MSVFKKVFEDSACGYKVANDAVENALRNYPYPLARKIGRLLDTKSHSEFKNTVKDVAVLTSKFYFFVL